MLVTFFFLIVPLYGSPAMESIFPRNITHELPAEKCNYHNKISKNLAFLLSVALKFKSSVNFRNWLSECRENIR